MIALLSAWLIGYALGRMWRPARKQKPLHVYMAGPRCISRDTIYTAQDSTK